MSTKHAWLLAKNSKKIRELREGIDVQAERSKVYPLQLLRAILRECTYLPDPAARTYIPQYVLDRYRAYQTETAYRPKNAHRIKGSKITIRRVVELIREARVGLHDLQRANRGEYPSMEKVLLLTYGRTGKRRHELLEPLKQPDWTGDHEGKDIVSRTMTEMKVSKKLLEKVPKLTMKMEALLHSQRKVQPLDLTRPNPKSLALKIPEENIWHRPLPNKNIVNLVEEWYSSMLEKVLPPLPRADWERLEALASGKLRWSGQIERRTLAAHGVEMERAIKNAVRTEEQIKDGYITRIVRTNEQPNDPYRALERILGFNRLKGSGGKEQPHRVTGRFMRRMWARIFEQCPQMDWDPSSQKWNVEWGRVNKKLMRLEARKPEGRYES